MSFSTDPLIKINLLLKNSWSLTGSTVNTGSITFSTYWYMTRPPNHWIVTECISPRHDLLTTGDQPLYRHNDVIGVTVFVRVDSDSETQNGRGKSDVYNMQKEVERILLSGSHITTGSREEFIQLHNWREMDQTKWLPILYRRQLQIDYWNFETGST